MSSQLMTGYVLVMATPIAIVSVSDTIILTHHDALIERTEMLTDIIDEEFAGANVIVTFNSDSWNNPATIVDADTYQVLVRIEIFPVKH